MRPSHAEPTYLQGQGQAAQVLSIAQIGKQHAETEHSDQSFTCSTYCKAHL
jgi:hypothetical protein